MPCGQISVFQGAVLERSWMMHCTQQSNDIRAHDAGAAGGGF